MVIQSMPLHLAAAAIATAAATQLTWFYIILFALFQVITWFVTGNAGISSHKFLWTPGRNRAECCRIGCIGKVGLVLIPAKYIQGYT